MSECEEPKCRGKAEKEWHGRKVCKDCHDTYRVEKERMHLHLDD